MSYTFEWEGNQATLREWPFSLPIDLLGEIPLKVSAPGWSKTYCVSQHVVNQISEASTNNGGGNMLTTVRFEGMWFDTVVANDVCDKHKEFTHQKKRGILHYGGAVVELKNADKGIDVFPMYFRRSHPLRHYRREDGWEWRVIACLQDSAWNDRVGEWISGPKYVERVERVTMDVSSGVLVDHVDPSTGEVLRHPARSPVDRLRMEDEDTYHVLANMAQEMGITK